MIGRRRELAEIGQLLDRVAAGSGGLLVILGAPGSGRTTMADAAAGLGRQRGFEVVRASVTGAGSGLLVWAQVMRDLGDPDRPPMGCWPGPGGWTSTGPRGGWRRVSDGSSWSTTSTGPGRRRSSCCRSSVPAWPADRRPWWPRPAYRWVWPLSCGWPV